MRPTLLALLCLPCLLPAQKGVSLEQLTELAKQRAARLRPELEKRLKPFLETLTLDPREKGPEIDDAVEAASKLGDAIVPLLLEKLEPRRESPTLKNLARNVARVLVKMDPPSFLDPLLEIAEGDSYTGSGLAIWLLGKTANERAGALLTRLLDRIDRSQRRIAYQALTELRYPGAALKVAKTLPLEDRASELAACAYLAAVPRKALVPEILRILEEIRRPQDVMRYLRILGKSSGRDTRVAHVMLPYFGNNKLDRTEWRELAQLLAEVSPKEEPRTVAHLMKIIETSSGGSLALEAALTLRALGEDDGAKLLQRKLLRETSSAKGKRMAYNWSNLGDFYLAIDELPKATSAYQRGIRVATPGSTRSRLYLQVAKVHARRKRWRDVRNALRDSRASLKVLLAEAREDAHLAGALEQKLVKEFLDSFPGR